MINLNIFFISLLFILFITFIKCLNQLKIIGHRGLPELFLESSKAGYINAAKYTNFIECDVVLDAQGEPYCWHDLFIPTDLITPDCNRSYYTVLDSIKTDSENNLYIIDQLSAFFDLIYLYSKNNGKRKGDDRCLHLLKFSEFLQIADKYNLSVYIEPKHYRYHRERGFDLLDIIKEKLIKSNLYRRLYIPNNNESNLTLSSLEKCKRQLNPVNYHYDDNIPEIIIESFNIKDLIYFKEAREFINILKFSLLTEVVNDNQIVYYEYDIRNKKDLIREYNPEELSNSWINEIVFEKSVLKNIELLEKVKSLNPEVEIIIYTIKFDHNQNNNISRKKKLNIKETGLIYSLYKNNLINGVFTDNVKIFRDIINSTKSFI